MAKRIFDSDPGSSHRKKRKTTPSGPNAAERPEIRSSKDLHELFTFHQELGPLLRQNLQSLQSFLASIAHGAEGDDASAKRALLLDYMQSQAPSEGNGASVYLGDFIKTWHFVDQSNVDSLFASVVAVLALLLKSISSFIDFREHGIRLCDTLLHDDQIKLFDRGLGAHRAKEFLISPCLQLLTEIVSFDGGHAARNVYRKREITYKRLDVFLAMHKDIRDDEVKDSKRRSVRDNAIGYLFANLRLQNPAAKMSIIAPGKVQRGLMDAIVEDSSSVILETLKVLRRDIAMDSGISQTAKGRFFNQWTLSQLVKLYSYNKSANVSEGHQLVKSAVHDFLVLLCTSPGCGLVEMRTASKGDVDVVPTDITLTGTLRPHGAHGSDDQSGSARRNPRLGLFLQTLRPHASVAQCELMLAAFRQFPELINEYFSSGKSFSFDPKLTMTWIGYSSFLLATIKTPLPQSINQLSVHDTVLSSNGDILESIIPKPCTQKVMTRCLNQSVDLVKLFAIQILNAAFEKFAKVLQIYQDLQQHTIDQQESLARSRALSQLRDDFCGRVPELKYVITQFRSCAKESTILRESISRLIASYYKVIPHMALEERLDISVTLSTALMDPEAPDKSPMETSMRLLDLDHLLEIAHRSPDMQWWHKPEHMWLSPFTMLLRLYLDRIQLGTGSEQLRVILQTITRESQLLRSDPSMTSLDNLVLSLQDFGTGKASDQLFEFFDQCVLRFVRKPVYYYDTFAEVIAAAKLDISPKSCNIDFLLIAIVDQWHFLVKSADAPTVTNISKWLALYIEVTYIGDGNLRELTNESGTIRLLSYICDQLKAEVEDATCRLIFDQTLEERPELQTLSESVATNNISKARRMSKPVDPSSEKHVEAAEIHLPPGPEEEHEDHPGLLQWTRHEVQVAISEGLVRDLILCLCSEHEQVRKQALVGIRAFMVKLEASEYSERQQTYVLGGEIVDTAEKVIAGGPLPYYAGILAAKFFLVLDDPLHLMYEKVNKFLNKGPAWNLTKLPSYWVDKILMNPPTDDDRHHQEAEWLLDGLIDGLRTSADMDMYRRCHIFERLLSFSASPSLPETCFQKIVDLLFRCTYVKGSSTLVTRCGLMSWISCRLVSCAMDDMTGLRLRSLASRVYETSDQGRVDDWTNGTLESTLETLRIAKRR